MAIFTLATYLMRLRRGIVAGVLTAPMRRNMVLRVYQRIASARVATPSARSMLGLLRSAGLGIRTQDFYRIHRAFRAAGILGARIQVLGPAVRPLKAAIPEWPGFMTRRYLYQFTMNVYDYRKDVWRQQPFRWSSNRIYSKTGAEREIRAWWRESGFSTEVDLDTVHFEAVWKNAEQ